MASTRGRAPAPQRAAMSSTHKDALAAGRREGRAVRRYLEALEADRQVRTRRRTPESVQMQLDQIRAHLDAADPVSRVHMIQERMNLEAELQALVETDLPALEADFVAHARSYGERRGITWAAWREAGVAASVLRSAGVPRTTTNPGAPTGRG